MKYKNGEYDRSKEKPKDECMHEMPINLRNIMKLNYQSQIFSLKMLKDNRYAVYN